MVSGAAAVLLGDHPAATPDDVKGALIDGATRISGGAARSTSPRADEADARRRLVAALPGRVPRPRPRLRRTACRGRRRAGPPYAAGPRRAGRRPAGPRPAGPTTEWAASRWTSTRWTASRWTATPLDGDPMDRGGMAVAELGVTPAPARRPRRLERRVGALIGAQLVVAARLRRSSRTAAAYPFGEPWVVATLALAFALTGFFAMSLEFHRHRFTFTLAEAVLAVGFFAVGPIGLAVAAALGECVNMVVQRHSPLKVAFNVSNRLAATTAAGVAFAALGQHRRARRHGVGRRARRRAVLLDPRRRLDRGGALDRRGDALSQRVRPLRDRPGCSRRSPPRRSGSSRSTLAEHGPFVPLLLAPIAAAVALERRLRGRATRRAPPLRAPVRVVGAYREPRRARRRAALARGRDPLARHGCRRTVLRDRSNDRTKQG